MAHTILGIDLGSYSVKLAHLQAGFRTLRLLSLHEQELLDPTTPAVASVAAPAAPAALTPVASPGTVASTEPAASAGPALASPTLHDRQLYTLRAMLAELRARPEMVAAALGGPVTLRVVNLPLSDPRKIEQVLPYELEGQLIGELEDQIVDHTVAQTGLPDEDAPPGSGPGQGARVLAAAAPRAEVEGLIRRLDGLSLEPRHIGATALSCAAIFAAGGVDVDYPAAVLDLGHETTHLLVVTSAAGERDLSVRFARSIGRGGRHLTAALSRALKSNEAAAAKLKHEADLESQAGGPWGAVRAALTDALRPLLRDLRQSLSSYAGLYGESPRVLLLCGGGARLRGLPAFLQNELELPVRLLPVPQASWVPGAAGSGPPGAPGIDPGELQRRFLSCAGALGLGLGLAAPAPQVNFRKGDLSYRTDYSFLRQKLPHLIAAGLSVLLCAGLTAVASLRGLQRESDQLEKSLRTETAQLFGEPRMDGAAVSAELRSVIASAKGGDKTIPSTSAFDILTDISQAAPQGGNLDITELTIRSKKTELKGTASSAQYVDDLAAALAKLPCFKQVDKGKKLTVTGTGADGKPTDLVQFPLTITTTCL